MEKSQNNDNEQELLINLNHVCKLCKKSYPCGKSLGGHMRSHVISNTHYNKSKHTLKFSHHNVGIAAAAADDNNDGYRGHYCLRDNPKKTWRIVDSNFGTKKDGDGGDHERVCKQCGKVFHSLKALCGHMSCHSHNNNKKDKIFKLNVGDNDNDYDDDDDILWWSEKGGSDDGENNSEIDQLEHDQEVAMCLMMLSRDHHYCNNNGDYLNVYCHGSTQKIDSLNLIDSTESSDNNSVILQDGSSSNFVKGKVGKCNKRKMGVCEEMDNSDSGYFENGAKELGSDGSIDGVSTSWFYKKPKAGFENESKFFECLRCNKRFTSHQMLVSHYMNHSTSSSISLEKPQFRTASTTTTNTSDARKGSGTKKVKGHKCPYCPKVFKSGQALGGHKRTHMMGSGGGSRLVVNRVVAQEPISEPEQKQPLIDLNLPAPVDEEACGNSQYLAL